MDNKTAAAREPPFDFAKESNWALKNFPELRKTTVFLNRDTNKIVYCPDPNLSRHFANVLEKAEGEKRKLPGSFVSYPPEGGKFFCLAHSFNNYSIFSHNPEREKAAVFDHELGHIIVEKGMHGDERYPSISECAADAFAALRRQQRFGSSCEGHSDAGLFRALMFMRGDISHFTLPVVDKIVIDAKTADFMSLTPEQTRKIAGEYAARFAPTEAEMKQLEYDLQYAKKEWKNLSPYNDRALRELAAATLRAPETSLTYYSHLNN